MRVRLTAVTILALSLACDRSPSAPSAVLGVSELRVSGTSRVAPETVASFTANLFNPDGSITNVSSLAEWSSSAPEILQLTPYGGAVGRSPGEATVTAKYQHLAHSLVVEVLEAGTFKLSGFVTEPGAAFGQGIYGATIEVVGGRGVGLRMTTKEYSGRYDLYGVFGNVQLRVTAAGYVTRLMDLVIDRPTYHLITLTAEDAPSGPLSGTWNLTVVAPDCAPLPEQARTRQFVADIIHTGSQRLSVRISSQSVAYADALIGQIASNEIALPLPHWPGDIFEAPYYALVDSLQPKGFVGYRGIIRARFDGTSANGVLDGGLDYYPTTISTGFAAPCSGPSTVTLQRK